MMLANFDTRWAAMAFDAADRDLEALQRAVSFLRAHYKGMEEPSADDIKWAILYLEKHEREKTAA